MILHLQRRVGKQHINQQTETLNIDFLCFSPTITHRQVDV
jgi:hypothetical protein